MVNQEIKSNNKERSLVMITMLAYKYVNLHLDYIKELVDEEGQIICEEIINENKCRELFEFHLSLDLCDIDELAKQIGFKYPISLILQLQDITIDEFKELFYYDVMRYYDVVRQSIINNKKI